MYLESTRVKDVQYLESTRVKIYLKSARVKEISRGCKNKGDTYRAQE